ncbi:MAG: cell division protein FtsA [Candidatus Paceibacterota bacterium]|jgi:cell division protein FtsA
MIRNITIGIDVGTSTVRVVVAERVKDEQFPRIIGIGSAESRGLRHGYITNMSEAVKSIQKAVAEAEKNSQIKIKRAFVSIGGISLSSETAAGVAIVSRGDHEVTKLDISKAIDGAEETLELSNKKIIQTVPISYRLDGKDIHGRPDGMQGTKLEVKTLFVTCLAQHLEDLIVAVSEAGVDVINVIASPMAASLVTLTDKQKIAGCILANIGAETVSIATFENGNIISLQVFSIGGTEITKDIALGLKIPLEEAEGIKIGSMISNYPKKKLDEIIEARLSDIFELIEKHLKKIGRSALLPAGIIITGGGSNLPLIEDLAKHSLKLPAKIGTAEYFAQSKIKPRDSSWFVALGLCISGIDPQNGSEPGSINESFKSFKRFIGNVVKQLLP